MRMRRTAWLAVLGLAACAGSGTQYKNVQVSTPAGVMTETVGVYTGPERDAEGKLVPPRPFHLVPRVISTPGGSTTVYMRVYE